MAATIFAPTAWCLMCARTARGRGRHGVPHARRSPIAPGREPAARRISRCLRTSAPGPAVSQPRTTLRAFPAAAVSAARPPGHCQPEWRRGLALSGSQPRSAAVDPSPSLRRDVGRGPVVSAQNPVIHSAASSIGTSSTMSPGLLVAMVRIVEMRPGLGTGLPPRCGRLSIASSTVLPCTAEPSSRSTLPAGSAAFLDEETR